MTKKAPLKRLIYFPFFLLLFLFFSCKNKESNMEEEIKNKTMSMDLHTLSNYNIVPISHTHLNLKVDFENKLLIGSVIHKIP